MNEWLIQQGVVNPQAGLVLGLLTGLLVAVLVAWLVSRKSLAAGQASLQPRIDELDSQLTETLDVLADAEKQNAVLEAQAVDREKHFREQLASLENAEKRLTENFERLSGRIFE